MKVADIIAQRYKEEQVTDDKFSFPLEVFPNDIQDYINELNHAFGFPTEYTAGAVLFATSLSIGNTREIELKNGFRSKANLFLITVGRPGANKTRPFNQALSFFRQKDHENFLEYKKLKDLYDAEQGKPSKERDESITKPDCINYLLNDFTPEVLAVELSKNNRGLGVFVDEILGWLKNMNRYSNGSDEEVYLSLWSGLSLKVNRVSKEQLNVKNPFLSIAGTIQPQKLVKTFKGKEDNGLTDRILFIYPDEVKSNLWNDEEIDLSTDEVFDNILLDLLRKLDFTFNDKGGHIAQIVKFSPEAREVIIKWQNASEKVLLNEDEEMQSIGAKMQDYCLRLALILHCLKWINNPTTDEFLVDMETARNAVKLTDYFTSQALKVRSLIYSNDVTSGLSEDKKNLINSLPKLFDTATAKVEGEKLNIAGKTLFRFLGNSKYFKKVAHGIYERLI